MYTYADLTPDLHLVAIGVVIWSVAVGIAFGVYFPVMRTNGGRTNGGRSNGGRANGKLLAGFSPQRRRADLPAYVPMALRVVEDLDHAALPLRAVADIETFPQPVIHEPAPAPVATPVAAAAAVAAPVAAPIAIVETPEPAAPCARPEVFSVLIVDDNTINRQVLEMILDSVGVAHASVENGREAVDAMRTCAYDAVLMDLQMPVMDGFEATRRIRALEATRGGAAARIVVVSANCADEDIADGRAAGADCHLAKPISAAAVIGELAACPSVERLAA
jgi:CheY-like chemotaxis protein